MTLPREDSSGMVRGMSLIPLDNWAFGVVG